MLRKIVAHYLALIINFYRCFGVKNYADAFASSRLGISRDQQRADQSIFGIKIDTQQSC